MRLLLGPLLVALAVASLPAEEIGSSPSRHLQVLPADIGERELWATMLEMNQALGVQCSYCHVAGDLASEANPELAANRRRIADILGWNRRRGRTKPLTCMGCHEGKRIPDYVHLPSGWQKFGALMEISGASSVGELLGAMVENGQMTHGFTPPDEAVTPPAPRPAGSGSPGRP